MGSRVSRPKKEVGGSIGSRVPEEKPGHSHLRAIEKAGEKCAVLHPRAGALERLKPDDWIEVFSLRCCAVH